MTDELVDYIHRAHNWSPEFMEARRQSVSLPHDYTPELAGIKAPVPLIHGRYDRMVRSRSVSRPEPHCRLAPRVAQQLGRWPPSKKPVEWAAQVLAFLRGATERNG